MFNLDIQYGIDLIVLGFWLSIRTIKRVSEPELDSKIKELLPRRSLFKRIVVQRIQTSRS